MGWGGCPKPPLQAVAPMGSLQHPAEVAPCTLQGFPAPCEALGAFRGLQTPKGCPRGHGMEANVTPELQGLCWIRISANLVPEVGDGPREMQQQFPSSSLSACPINHPTVTSLAVGQTEVCSRRHRNQRDLIKLDSSQPKGEVFAAAALRGAAARGTGTMLKATCSGFFHGEGAQTCFQQSLILLPCSILSA